jgi:hypothetical protein
MTLKPLIPSKAPAGIAALSIAAVLFTLPAAADSFTFSTGNPDGLIGTASRPSSAGRQEIETGDDFVLTQSTSISHGTITGLVPNGASVTRVDIEVYRVFPADSDVNRTSGPPTFSTPQVPTRVNSPSDVELDPAHRASSDGSLSFSTSVLQQSFTVANTVVNGINPLPNIFTGGEGPATGQEVRISMDFTTPIDLSADHFFLVPQIELSTGDFLWLSAVRPIVPPGTPFSPDLQSWIRDEALQPDWLRIGTDITHQGPFNASFSLDGVSVPGPIVGAGLPGLLAACAGMMGLARRRRKAQASA